MLSPIRGRKLDLKFDSYDPEKKKIKTLMKVKTSKSALGIKTAVVEDGTCKYCDKCMPLKDMKEHYLTHKTTEDTEQINSTENEHHSEKPIKEVKEKALQENFISSTETIEENDEQKLAEKKTTEDNGSEISKEVSEENSNNVCSEFIKRWGSILDIDDASQYEDKNSESADLFFEGKKKEEDKTNNCTQRFAQGEIEESTCSSSYSCRENVLGKVDDENSKDTPKTVQDENDVLSFIRNPLKLSGASLMLFNV